MSSLFAVVLGYSRVPYAAAVDGNFFKIFSKLHPTKQFPYVSLIVLCIAGFIFSLFMKLGDVITAILAMRIVIQFMSQSVGVVLLRRRNGTTELPYKMWLYPIPVILSLVIWSFLLYHNPYAKWGGLIALIGIAVYIIKQAIERQKVNSL
jgi:amino acid transporter